MDCKTARLLLEFDRPAVNELDAAEHEALQGHIAECPDCGPIAHVERRADHEIGKVMRSVAVPVDGAARVLARLEEQRRSRRRRRWLGRVGMAAAAAAVLLAALYLGWQRNQPVKVDLEVAATEEFGKSLNPQPSTVENWFREHGIEMVAPPDFNYRLLKDYSVTRYQGKLVPELIFRSDQEKATVRVLPTSQFQRPEADRFPGSGFTAVWRTNPSDKRFAYLIVFTGSSLDRFLMQSPPGET